jgi:hypothetical protein
MSAASWISISQALPRPLTDVLLHQFPLFPGDQYLISIGYRDNADRWVDTYSSQIGRAHV